ncbi:MAG: DJ-1/PfpI family protein, partial [Candidatus Eisenbacteria bacterium]|nr:DJ-1/PfpI family protein [Candidatus Eisenbacteria bacterium]
MRTVTTSNRWTACAAALVAVCMSAVLLAGCGAATEEEEAGVDVLYLMSESYGVNYYLSTDRFELLGWNATRTALSDTVPACPPYADQLGVPPVASDALVSDVGDGSEYDCLVLASSSAYVLDDPFRDLMADSTTLELVRGFAERGTPVFAPCAGVRVLAAAGLLEGRSVVGTPKFSGEFEAAGAAFLGNDHPPVTDGGIITGVRGMYYAAANAEAIAVALEERGPRGDHPEGANRFVPSSELVGTDGDTGVVWARTYGGASADGARSVCKTPDGGFLLVGYTFSQGTGDADMLIVKVDSSGRPEWFHVSGGAGTEYGLACAALSDGYLAAGFTTSFGSGGRDAYLVKLDASGRESWSVTLGGEATDVAGSVCACDDGYLIAGHTESLGAGESDVYLAKVDKDGREVWSRRHGGERFEVANTMWPTGDGGFLVSAS